MITSFQILFKFLIVFLFSHQFPLSPANHHAISSKLTQLFFFFFILIFLILPLSKVQFPPHLFFFHLFTPFNYLPHHCNYFPTGSEGGHGHPRHHMACKVTVMVILYLLQQYKKHTCKISFDENTSCW